MLSRPHLLSLKQLEIQGSESSLPGRSRSYTGCRVRFITSYRLPTIWLPGSPTILKALFCTRLTVAARTWLGHVLPVDWSVHRSDWELSPKGSSKGSRDMTNSSRCVSGWASWRNGDAKRATKPIKVKEHERARTPSTDSGSGDCPVPLDVFRTGPGTLGPLSCSHLTGKR
jgi:hypothetical protein